MTEGWYLLIIGLLLAIIVGGFYYWIQERKRYEEKIGDLNARIKDTDSKLKEILEQEGSDENDN